MCPGVRGGGRKEHIAKQCLQPPWQSVSTHLSSRTGAAHDLHDDGKLDGLILRGRRGVPGCRGTDKGLVNLHLKNTHHLVRRPREKGTIRFVK